MEVQQSVCALLLEEGELLPSGIKAELVTHGVAVDVCYSVAEGVQRFDRQRHHVVVLVEGSNSADEALQCFADSAPLIVVSENDDVARAVQLIKQGAQDYLVCSKPDFCERLQNAVYEHAGQRFDNGLTRSADLATLEERTRLLLQLNEASHRLTSTLQSNQVVRQMLSAATGIVGAKDASVWTWADGTQQHLVCRATSNQTLWRQLRQQRLQRDEGVAGWVVATGKGQIVNDVRLDEHFLPAIDDQTGFTTQSLLAVPLCVGDQVIGVLEIINKSSGQFEHEDMLLAEMLAASAATALENARLIEQLQNQTLQLQARNDELDAFAHTVAHDLKTPLNWVAGYIELLHKDWRKINEPERLEYVEAIANGARTMNNIIDDLLLLASLRQSEVVLEPIDMGSVLRRARERLAPLIREHNAELTTPARYPIALGYAPWIEGVWVNYISNALKYGGHPPHVRLGYHENGGKHIVFWVEDNGSGLTEEQQQQLFVPFSRLSATRAAGHGLGLSIVRRIVEKLGGSVGVDNAAPQGSRFYFTLQRG